jgi:hypothetical protein
MFKSAWRHLLVAAMSAVLTGCAAPPSSTTGYGQPVYSGVQAPIESTCVVVPAHTQTDGTLVPDAYRCPSTLSSSSLSAYGCTWVSGYSRSDGTWVQSHHRCGEARAASPASSSVPGVATGSSSSSSASDAPCVTGYCGPTSVKGYYRKDGTYVRPHTRSRSRR